MIALGLPITVDELLHRIWNFWEQSAADDTADIDEFSDGGGCDGVFRISVKTGPVA